MTIEPITLTVTVECDQAAAFDLWTKGLASWWPVEPHSIAGAQVATLVFEDRTGGRVYEVANDGTESTWAEIERWDPPNGFALRWHPGYEDDTATCVEVTFAPAPDGGTEVRLEHRDWERLGARAAESRASYASGWVTVVGAYVAKAPSRIHEGT